MNLRRKIIKFDFLLKATEIAKECNCEIYIVGGCVRDLLLKREVNEIDIQIVGNENGFVRKFSSSLNIKKVTVFKNFGTSHFKFKNYDLEFVQARKESYTQISRNPLVTNGTFEDDISRRDFTINTLAISLNKKNYAELIDTYNGVKDIENKIIKTPLDPNITFSDDPLRIMRAFRFASVLNFSVVDKIKTSANKNKERLKIVSQERITNEFLKILSSKKPSIGLILLQETEVMSVIFPEIANLAGAEQINDFHHKEVFIHTCQVVDNISEKTENIWLRFAALVHDIAKPRTKKFVEGIGWTFHGHEEIGARMMRKIFNRLKLPFTNLKYIENLIRLHLRPIALAKSEVTDSAIRRFIVDAGENMDDLIVLCRADITSKNENKVKKYFENYERVIQKVYNVKEKDRLSSFQSPVRGEEIMKICNIKPSKKVGEIKKEIEDAILDGTISNTYEDAYNYLLKIKNEF